MFASSNNINPKKTIFSLAIKWFSTFLHSICINTLGLRKLHTASSSPHFPFSRTIQHFTFHNFTLCSTYSKTSFPFFRSNAKCTPFTTHSNLLGPFPPHVIPSHPHTHTLHIKRLPIPSPPLLTSFLTAILPQAFIC